MILYIVSIGFFLYIIKKTFFWVSLWQVKEYRLDRLRIHLTETSQGRKIFRSPFPIFFLFLIGVYIFVILQDAYALWYQMAVTGVFALAGVVFIAEIIKFSFKRPVFTLKAFVITLLTIVTVIGLFLLPILDIYVWLPLLGLSLPIFVAIYVSLFSFPSEIYTDFLIQKAKKKLDVNKKLLCIGVSGSYGKSSTKEYLAHILSKKYIVVKTPLSNNTPIGVAKTILNKLTKSTEILIVEMGAYKKGEVAKLCEVVKPDIAITTSISDQHLSLFKSIENVVSTEAELLHALSRKGYALANANSSLTHLLTDTTKKKLMFYGTQKAAKTNNLAIQASDILVKKNEVFFTVYVKKERMSFSAPLLGGQQIENILPAIFIARMLQISIKDIQEAVKSLKPLPKTMKKFTLQNGVVVVDDTFNASPESVLSALSYMKIYPKKRIFVMSPLIELGRNAKERHREIGKALKDTTTVFLANKNFYKEIMQGLQSVRGKTKLIVASPDDISRFINEKTQKGDIVVFEGKEAGMILNTIL